MGMDMDSALHQLLTYHSLHRNHSQSFRLENQSAPTNRRREGIEGLPWTVLILHGEAS